MEMETIDKFISNHIPEKYIIKETVIYEYIKDCVQSAYIKGINDCFIELKNDKNSNKIKSNIKFDLIHEFIEVDLLHNKDRGGHGTSGGYKR